jgi:iron uptake system component EfeO
VPAGPVEVVVTNLDAPTVSEVEVRTSDLSSVLGEKEDLVEGMTAQFSAFLGPGRYVVNCPGATEPHWLLIATSPRPRSGR